MARFGGVGCKSIYSLAVMVTGWVEAAGCRETGRFLFAGCSSELTGASFHQVRTFRALCRLGLAEEAGPGRGG